MRQHIEFVLTLIVGAAALVGIVAVLGLVSDADTEAVKNEVCPHMVEAAVEPMQARLEACESTRASAACVAAAERIAACELALKTKWDAHEKRNR